LLSKVDEFKKRINELKIWEYIEIKTCLIRLEPTDKWKVGLIRIQLLNYGRSEKKILLDHDNIKLIREIKKVNILNDILDRLLTNQEIEIVSETASLEYFTEQISFDFKDRTGMTNNYYVDSACYFLTRSPSNNLIGLSDIQHKLRLKLPRHTKPYEDLNQVCSLLLGVNFGGAYYPQILVFAPIFIKIDRFRLMDDNLIVYLYCSRRIRLEEFSVSAFGKDMNGGLTFSERFINFRRLNDESEIASSSLQITAKNTASIKLELYYEKGDYYLEQYNRPFADSITLNLDKEEIKKKLTK
jgi:hypothetical protein